MNKTTSSEKGLWACDIAYCDFIYNPQIGDPEQGVQPGTRFEDLPGNWICPKCGIAKDFFHPYDV